MSRRKLIGLAVIVLGLFIAVGGFLVWRFTAPIEVHIEAEIHDLPFYAEIYPPVITAYPGEMVKVLYRVYNTDVRPLEAFGRYEIAPGFATDQVKVYLTQCSGLNTFQYEYPSDYEVLFRVQPAGLGGSTRLALRHIFTPATLR